MVNSSNPGSATQVRDPRRWAVLGVLCLALLVVVLDNSVLVVAVPSITESLGATTAQIQWVINAYSLVLAGLLMTSGLLVDRLGRKRALIAGVVVFTAGSLWAAYASTPEMLIAARAGMGIGAAFLMPGTLAVLADLFDDEERPRAIAVWSAVASLGLVLGPLIGGVLLAHLWWGAVFLINLPVGLVTVFGLGLMLAPSVPRRSRSIDGLGSMLSILFGVGLVYAVISAPEHGWRAPITVVPLVVGVAALGLFLLWERRTREPMLDMGLFANPRFTAGVVTGALLAFSLGGSLFLFAQYLQFSLGYPALLAGAATIPLPLAVLSATPLSPKLIRRLGAPNTIAAGLLTLAVGLLLLGTVAVGSDYVWSLLGLMLVGLGVGTATPASTTALLGAIPMERGGIASGLTSMLQEFGNAFGVAVLGSVAAARFASAAPEAVPEAARNSVGLALSASAGDANVIDGVRSAFVSGVALSLTGAAAAMAIAAVLCGWLSRRPVRNP